MNILIKSQNMIFLTAPNFQLKMLLMLIDDSNHYESINF